MVAGGALLDSVRGFRGMSAAGTVGMLFSITGALFDTMISAFGKEP